MRIQFASAHLVANGVCKSWHWKLFDPENAICLFVWDLEMIISFVKTSEVLCSL